MSKQLLIYESAVPVSEARHRDVSLEPIDHYAFSAEVNAVPLMAVEFLHAATEYAIVFTDTGDEVLPAVVLGVRDNQNLYLSPDRRWTARYVPAFIRRYPFVFSHAEDGRTFTLCIDETHPGVNRAGRGQRLFGDDGKPSAYTERVLRFLQEYQAAYERTRSFGRRVKALGLLEPMRAQVVTPKGNKFSLGGFFGVQRGRLRALPAESLQQLASTDELELLYLQMHSMRNFEDVKERLVGALGDQEPAPAGPLPPLDPVTTLQ